MTVCHESWPGEEITDGSDQCHVSGAGGGGEGGLPQARGSRMHLPGALYASMTFTTIHSGWVATERDYGAS
jgi:hypothetical protein